MTPAELVIECRLALAESTSDAVPLPRNTLHGIVSVLVEHLKPPSAKKPLTSRQHEILLFLVEHRESSGVAPTLDEIADHFGYQSLATVSEHLANLEKKGHIRREAGSARGIEILGPEPDQKGTMG